MNELKIFENPEFGKVRTMIIDEKPYFAGTDVANVLGYARPSKAILDHCRSVLKRDISTLSKNQYGAEFERSVEMSFIPESDVYRLVMRSNLPNAERFQDWVVEEVLPSIRKHGAFMTPATAEQILNNPDLMIELLQNFKAEREKVAQLEAKAEEDRPKVLFAQAVESSDNSILVGDLAKILRGNGVQIGQNRLFQQLREQGYLIKRIGANWNMPTQRSMELGVLEITERAIANPDGSVRLTRTPKVTGKGQTYFVNLFLGEKRLPLAE